MEIGIVLFLSCCGVCPPVSPEISVGKFKLCCPCTVSIKNIRALSPLVIDKRLFADAVSNQIVIICARASD